MARGKKRAVDITDAEANRQIKKRKAPPKPALQKRQVRTNPRTCIDQSGVHIQTSLICQHGFGTVTAVAQINDM